MPFDLGGLTAGGLTATKPKPIPWAPWGPFTGAISTNTDYTKSQSPWAPWGDWATLLNPAKGFDTTYFPKQPSMSQAMVPYTGSGLNRRVNYGQRLSSNNRRRVYKRKIYKPKSKYRGYGLFNRKRRFGFRPKIRYF